MEGFKKHIYFSKEANNYFHLALLLIFGTAVLILAYIAYVSTIFYLNEIEGGFSSREAPKVSLSLIPDKPFYKSLYRVGDNVDVLIVLDAPLKKVSGVDVLLEYDPSYLEINEKDSGQKSDVLKYLNTQFSSFDIFPYFKIDEERGKIIFSALTKPLREFVGTSGRIAEISFKTIKKGETEIKFNFERNSSLESNVASGGRDVLENTKDLKLIIE